MNFSSAPPPPPYLVCARCGTQYTGSVVRVGSPCVMSVVDESSTSERPRPHPCDGHVVDVGAEVARIAHTYDPVWWIVTTGENAIAIDPRWQTPLRASSWGRESTPG